MKSRSMRMRKKTRRAGKNRRGTRRMKGGGLGQSYGFTGAPVLGGVDTGLSWSPQSSCMAAQRFGTIQPPQNGLGLPGLSGGGRKNKRKSQKGGRYGFDLSQQIAPATPFLGGIPPVQKIPCEAATPNPLNPRPMTGGAGAPLGYSNIGDTDSARYIAPTAGYTNTPSTWVGSTGSPSLLQTPYEARTMNPACLKTGGGSRRHRNKKYRRRH